jgi:hypothetical protein
LPSLGNQIADGNDIDIRVILEAEGCPKAAYAVTDDSNPHLSF